MAYICQHFLCMVYGYVRQTTIGAPKELPMRCHPRYNRSEVQIALDFPILQTKTHQSCLEIDRGRVEIPTQADSVQTETLLTVHKSNSKLFRLTIIADKWMSIY